MGDRNRAKGNDVLDYDCIWVRETAGAIAVRMHEDASLVWLPKSQIEYERKDSRRVTVTVPDWLAEEKDLA